MPTNKKTSKIKELLETELSALFSNTANKKPAVATQVTKNPSKSSHKSDSSVPQSQQKPEQKMNGTSADPRTPKTPAQPPQYSLFQNNPARNLEYKPTSSKRAAGDNHTYENVYSADTIGSSAQNQVGRRQLSDFDDNSTFVYGLHEQKPSDPPVVNRMRQQVKKSYFRK